MRGTPRCAAGSPHLQQLHLAEGGPLQTQPCAHLAHPAGQQEQQPVKREKNELGGSQGEIWGGPVGGGWSGNLPPSLVHSPFSSIPILAMSPRVVLHQGRAGPPRAHQGPPAPHRANPPTTAVPGGASIRSSQKKSQCWFPARSSACAEPEVPARSIPTSGLYWVAGIAWWRVDCTLCSSRGMKVQEE